MNSYQYEILDMSHTKDVLRQVQNEISELEDKINYLKTIENKLQFYLCRHCINCDDDVACDSVTCNRCKCNDMCNLTIGV